MARLDHLIANYKRHLGIKLRSDMPLSQRVWFLVYPPEEERRLQYRLEEFRIAAAEAGLGWLQIDLTGSFTRWIDTFGEFEKKSILQQQDIIESYARKGFCRYLAETMTRQATMVPAEQAPKTIFALTGLMELYDFIDVSSVIDALSKDFPGVLAVFFPGERENTSYRFLNARTSWDYLAVPLTCEAITP